MEPGAQEVTADVIVVNMMVEPGWTTESRGDTQRESSHGGLREQLSTKGRARRVHAPWLMSLRSRCPPLA